MNIISPFTGKKIYEVESMFEVVDKKDRWDKIINGFDEFDFYHFYEYHQACLNEGEVAQLLYYNSGQTTIAFPLVLRPIENSGYFDITSVYGYLGPLISSNYQISNLMDCQRHIRGYFVEKRIVSAFSNLNPFIPNQIDLLKGFGEIEDLGGIVYVDFQGEEGDHLMEYSSMTRRFVKRNRKLFTIKEGKTKEDAQKFMELYYKTMDRIKAEPQYYFDLPYFMKLVNSNEFDARFVFAHAKKNDEIGAGAFIIYTDNHIIQYHLSATSEKYRRLSPIRTVIDYVKKSNIGMGFRYFNLGGGVGSSFDSLYEFKASFSQLSKPFRVWKFVVNKKVYVELCEKYSTAPDTGTPNYFPRYRVNLKDSMT